VAALDGMTSETGPISQEVKKYVNAGFWIWYYNHKALSIPVKIWKISVNVRIEKLKGLFVLLFGEDSALNNG
jgi:hypothetical protein